MQTRKPLSPSPRAAYPDAEWSGNSRPFIAFGAFITWIAIILQFYLILDHRVKPVIPTIIRFFSYFTILANIIAALSFSVLLIRSSSRLGSLLGSPNAIAAISTYITIVGLVYNLILRQLWAPTGMQKLADELLHLLDPVYYLLFWLIFVPKAKLSWNNIIPWLWFPLIYLVYVLIRGQISREYPYPFIDVNVLGYPKVFQNCAILLIVFIVVALLFVGLAKLITGRRK